MSAPQTAAAPAVGRRRVYWQAGLAVALLVGAVCLARRHWPAVADGASRLAGADHGWLLVAAVAALGTWAAAALAQQGAVPEPLPVRRLLAAQFAASSANHLLPVGLGAGAVNLRFLMRCGLTTGRSATALAVKTTASAVVRCALIAVLALARPGVLRMPHVPGAVLAALLGCAALLAVVPRTRLWPRCLRALTAVSADVRAVHARPRRATALWGGSLAFVLLHSLVLICVTQAVELPLGPVRVTLLYLAASSAAALLPTPGGFGSLDAALAFALTLGGASAAGAASVVLGYRLLTVWLPLLPGLAVLGVLVRRRAL
ncbi:lysylphosphatidylglycerol synthase domain-containing protein [Streptomyces griseoviridis]|uniref:lysylphosphatidylglycerol synthase transmembrane domain-containing protein n=1 Tax=Streptomyces griseoviridis TaxID=45398 RepID=UPI0033D22CE0